MTVREFMALWVDSVGMRVYQKPIKEIDKYPDLICRQTGSVDVLINSNQNYLNFEILNVQYDDGLIIIVCEANEKQKQRIINSHKYRYKKNLYPVKKQDDYEHDN